MNQSPKVVIRFPATSNQTNKESKLSKSTSPKLNNTQHQNSADHLLKNIPRIRKTRRSSQLTVPTPHFVTPVVKDSRSTQQNKMDNPLNECFRKIIHPNPTLYPIVSMPRKLNREMDYLKPHRARNQTIPINTQFMNESYPNLGKRSYPDLDHVHENLIIQMNPNDSTNPKIFLNTLSKNMKRLKPKEKRRYSLICNQIMDQFLDKNEEQIKINLNRSMPREDQKSKLSNAVSIQNSKQEDSVADYVPSKPVKNPFRMSIKGPDPMIENTLKKIKNDSFEDYNEVPDQIREEIKKIVDQRFIQNSKNYFSGNHEFHIKERSLNIQLEEPVPQPIIPEPRDNKKTEIYVPKPPVRNPFIETNIEKPKEIFFKIAAEISNPEQKEKILKKLTELCDTIPELKKVFIEKNIRKNIKRTSIQSKRSSISSQLSSRRNSLRYFSQNNFHLIFDEDNSKMTNLMWNITQFFEEKRKDKLLKQMKRAIQSNLKIAANEGQEDKLGFLLLKLSLQVKITEKEFHELKIEEKLRFMLLFVSKYINKKKISIFFEPFMDLIDISSESKLLGSLK